MNDMTPPAVLRLLQRFNGASRAGQGHGAGDHEDESEPRATWAFQPWRRSPFVWQQRGLSGEKIGAFLIRHGFRPMAPPGPALLDAAIADPLAAIEDPVSLWAAMFGRQLVEYSVDAVEGEAQPRADRLLAALAAAARPGVELTDVRQVIVRGRLLVMFRCLGQRHALSVSRVGSRLDVDAVLSGFNALMARLTHPCRGFRIDCPLPAPGGATATVYLIITRADRFEAAARAIAIPLVAPAPALK